MKQKTGILIALVSFLFAGCSFLFENNDLEQRQSDGQTACIYVKSADVLQNTARQNRTALPSAIATNLTDLVLKGGKTGDSQIELAHADTLQELSQQVIEVSAGLWNFTLEAKLNGIAFSGSITGKNIRGGKSFSLSFGLTTNASYGGFSITVAFEGSADLAYGILYYEDDTLPPVIAKTQLPVTENTVTFAQNFTETTGLAGGTYKAKILFYKKDTQNNNNEIPLNTYEEAVQISPGYRSTSEITINLTSTYSIIYHYDDEASLAFGETMPKQYSRISGDITLPVMQKEGFVFDGWFGSASCDGFAITSIPHGSTGTKEYWAKFSEKPAAVTYFVASSNVTPAGNDDYGDGSEDSPYATIGKAYAAIKEYSNDTPTSNNFIIKIDGILTSQQGLSGAYELQNPIDTITIEGKNGLNVSGIPKDGIVVDDSSNPALGISSYPTALNQIIIKNLRITNESYGGLRVGDGWSSENRFLISCVVLDQGTLITGCGNSQGVAVIGRSTVVMKAGAKISYNKCGAYVEGGTYFIMQGGEISGNTSGVRVTYYSSSGPGHFQMSGRALVTSENDVYLETGAGLEIAGPITLPAGVTSAATITPAYYNANSQILGLAVDHYDNETHENVYIDTTNIEAEYAKFTITSDYSVSPAIDWIIDNEGKLQQGSSSAPITFFVGASGNDTTGNGMSGTPFASVSQAADVIMQMLDSRTAADAGETVCTIKVDGTIRGSQTVGDENTYKTVTNLPKSFVIEGANGLGDYGYPKDSLNGNQEGIPLSINTNIPVTIKNLMLSYGRVENGDGGGLRVGGSDQLGDWSSTTVILQETFIESNVAKFGSGLYIFNKSTVIMKGGRVGYNETLSGGKGSGICIGENASLTLKDDAYITGGDDIYLKSLTSRIYIASILTQRKVATIIPYRYTADDTIVELANDADPDLTSEFSKLKITVQTDNNGEPIEAVYWKIDENGKLQVDESSSTGESITFYVAQSGSDVTGDGSETKPFQSIYVAAEEMQEKLNSKTQNACWNSDCTIKIKGMLGKATAEHQDTIPMAQMFGMSHYYMEFEHTPNSFTIEGATGPDANGIPQDGIDATGCEGSALTINTNVRVALKNLKLTGANNTGSNTANEGGGLHIGGDGSGSNSSNTIVYIVEGILITENSANYGGGVYIYENSTLQFGDGKITGNDGVGAGVFVSDNAKLSVGGNSLITSDNAVMLAGFSSKLEIAGPLTQSEVATIIPCRYQADDRILELACIYQGGEIMEIDTTDLETEHNKFKVAPQEVEGSHLPWHIDENGRLQEGVGSSGGSNGNVINLYVAPEGTGLDINDGLSADSPFKTITRALQEIESIKTGANHYVINVGGSLYTRNDNDNNQIIIESATAASVTIRGTGSNEMNGQYDNEGAGTFITVSCNTPIIFEKIKIAGGCASGSNNGSEAINGGCIHVSPTGNVVLGQGAFVQGGKILDGNGGGVYVENGGTFVMKDDARLDADSDGYSEVYLEPGAKITIGNNLTPEIMPIAYIRVPDSEYVESTELQVLEEASTGLISTDNTYQMFRVICPEGKSGHNWGYNIDSSGKLSYYNYN